MKKIVALVLAAIMVFALCACGSAAQASAPAATAAPAAEPAAPAAEPAAPAEPEAKSFKIGYITSDPSSGFWKEVLESFQAATSEAGIEMSYQAVSDGAGMRSAYDSLVAQQCDIIVNGYASEEVALAYAQEAVDTGMPMLCVSFNCPVEGVWSYGTSNAGMGNAYGEFAVESLAKEWEGKCDLIITCNAYTAVPAMASRTDNAVVVMQENGYTDTEWVAIDTGLDTSTIGANISATLTSHPDAQNVLIVVCTDAFCPTIVNAIADAGFTDKVMMISSDCTATYIAYAKEHHDSGEWPAWYASLDLDTAHYGYKILAKVNAIMAGENPEVYTEHSGAMVTAENILDFYG